MQNHYGRQTPPERLKEEKLPADYIEQAEKVICDIRAKKDFTISMSKLRNLYSMAADIYNAERLRSESTLSEQSMERLTMLRIRTVYECGREMKTSEFVKDTKLLQYIKGVGNNRESFLQLFHYMEALVAYHRYYFHEKEA